MSRLPRPEAKFRPDGSRCKCECHTSYNVMHISACCKPCVFCMIANYEAPANIVWESEEAIAFVPLNPVTDGHRLVVPKRHVSDASTEPDLTGYIAYVAAKIARPPYNLIVNCGSEASQTVFHLHWHIVPRRKGDGLLLPWTNQEA